MTTPYSMVGPPPAAPPPKNRTGMYIALACGCLALVLLLIAGVGGGVWLLSRKAGEETPSSSPAVTEPSAGEPSAEDPTEPEGAEFTISVSSPEEGTTLDTQDETLTTEEGKFIGVAVTITNDGEEEIGLSSSRFLLVDTDGTEHTPIYGSFSTSGPSIAPDEEATALLYADVPEETELESIVYTDDVATGGTPASFPVG